MAFPGLGSYDPSALLDLGEYLESDYLDTASLKTDSVTATYTDPGGGIPIPQLRRFDLSNLALGSIAESPSHSPNPFLWSSSSSSSNVNPTSSSLGQKLGGVFLSSSATSSASSAPIQIKQEIPEDVDLMKNLSMFPMEEDDIFQVDKNDLIQGPTLAELNANDESLLGDLNFDDFLLPADSPNPMTPLAVSEDSPDRYPFMASNSNSASFVSKSEHIPNMGLDPTLQSQPFSTAVSSPAPPPYNALLSASYPSRVSHVSRKISETRLGRRQREPPPPYPSTASPHSPSPLSSSPRPRPFQRPSTLQELLTLKSSTEASATGAASASSAPKVTVSGNAHAHGPVTRTTPSPHRPGGVVSPAPSHPAASVLGQSVPKSALTAANPLLLSRLSSSAPTHLGFEQLWQRREPRPHLLSTSSLAEELQGGSTSSLSTVGILSPGSFDFSQDEGFSSEDDSDDQFEDVDDSDSDLSGNEDGAKGLRRHGPKGTASTSRSSTSTKKERYFWQYNVQAKGPKGQRLTVNPTMTDPHVLNEIQDPVFSPHCAVDGVKHRLSLVHSGKARRGDGNDLTPNPRKLHNIGKELDKLNRLINDMTPVSELPVAVRPKSRKEKNKLASRACRLKKKAQHEANKVKLFGLEQEHRRLMSCVQQVQQLVASKWELLQQQGGGATPNPLISQVSQRVELVYQGAQKLRVASESTEFVNRVLERVKNGEPSGGLDEI